MIVILTQRQDVTWDPQLY